eukprot:4398055-Prymnesium_polylepis.1
MSSSARDPGGSPPWVFPVTGSAGSVQVHYSSTPHACLWSTGTTEMHAGRHAAPPIGTSRRVSPGRCVSTRSVHRRRRWSSCPPASS